MGTKKVYRYLVKYGAGKANEAKARTKAIAEKIVRKLRKKGYKNIMVFKDKRGF